MIRLAPGSAEDLPLIVRWNEDSGPEFLMQWAGPGLTYPLTEEQLHRHLDTVIAGTNEERRFYRIIEEGDRGDWRTVGVVELSQIDLANRSARVARFLLGDPSVRGRGIGTAALTLLLDICFDQLDLHRVSLAVFDFNEAAARCYEKVGFRKEGLIREARRVGERYWSYYEMSILSREYRTPSEVGKRL